MFVFPAGRASLQTSSWALTRRGWRRAALRCSSASATSPETNASPSTSCSCPTAAPSVCQLTRKCTSFHFCLSDDTFRCECILYLQKLREKVEQLQVKRRDRKLIKSNTRQDKVTINTQTLQRLVITWCACVGKADTSEVYRARLVCCVLLCMFNASVHHVCSCRCVCKGCSR